MISFLFHLLGSLLPSISLFVLGYFITLQFAKKLGRISSLDRYFISLILGTGLIIIPTLFWILVMDSSLSQFFVIYTSIAACGCIYFFVRNFGVVKDDFRKACWIAKNMINGDVFEKFALISLIVFLVKIVYYLSIVPVNVDALYFYLPSALHFTRFGHVYPYADPPVTPLLFSWNYSITGGLVDEPFRQIPLLYILSAPLLVFSISRHFFTRRHALIALILCAFSPFLDTGTYLWPWHTDFIAGAFGGLAIFFAIEHFRYHEAFAGLSLSLSILTKTPFGLAAAIIILVLLLNSSKEKRLSARMLSGISFVLILSFLLFFGLEYSFSLISFMYPQNLALLASSIVIVVLTISFSRSRTSTTTNIWILIFTLSPVIIWTFRQVILGGTPFALPIFPTRVPDTDWWISFKSQIVGTSSLGVGYFFLVFYHPLLGLCTLPLLLLGLPYAFKGEKTKTLLLVAFLYYFIWLSGFSRGASFRHLYPAIFFLYPMIVLGFFKVTRLFKIQSSSKVFLMLLFFTLLNSTQSMGAYLAYQDLTNNPLRWILSNLINEPPWLRYENPSEVLPFMSVIVCGFILAFLFPIMLRKTKASFITSFHRLSFNKLTTLTMFVLYSSFAMIAPLTYSAMVSTDGDHSHYSISESWYKYQIDMCDDLRTVVQEGRILTFGFDAFYYLASNNLMYYDLWHGHITSFPYGGLDDYHYLRETIEAKDISTIASAMSYFDIRYILLPLPGAYEYEAYIEFNKISQMFTILIESGPMQHIKSYERARFDLYSLDFNETICSRVIFSDDFSEDLEDWTNVYGSWFAENGEYCGNYAGFGISVAGDANWTDVIVKGDVKGKEDVREIGIVFRYKDPSNYYRAFIAGDWKQLRVMKMVNGSATYPEGWVRWITTSPNVWYTLKVIATGNTFKIFLNGEYKFSVTDPNAILSGKIGVGSYDEESCFDNIEVSQIWFKNPLS